MDSTSRSTSLHQPASSCILSIVSPTYCSGQLPGCGGGDEVFREQGIHESGVKHREQPIAQERDGGQTCVLEGDRGCEVQHALEREENCINSHSCFVVIASIRIERASVGYTY